MKKNGKRIMSNLNILGGKPVIKGTRISVSLILNLLSNGMTIEKITEEYPHLKEDDVCAAIEYAEGIINKEEIEVFKVSR